MYVTYLDIGTTKDIYDPVINSLMTYLVHLEKVSY